jgi:hypothetical protein
VGTVICVQDPDMKQAWCLAASSTYATTKHLTGYCGRRWGIECALWATCIHTVLRIDKLEFADFVTISVLSKPDGSSIPLALIVANCREKIPLVTAADAVGHGLNRCRDHR